MSILAKRDGLRHPRPFGFSMVGMLVAAVLLFALLFLFVSFLNAPHPARMGATMNTISAIRMALEGYRNEFSAYPPSTGFVALDGTTVPFSAGEITQADSLYKHLYVPINDPVSGRTIGPFLQGGSQGILSVKTASGTVRILLDPFGNPIRFDTGSDRDGKPTPRVWSLGPDGKEGPVPFSRVQTITDPRDEDNFPRWR